MSFLDYLKDNRGQFVDHRGTGPATPGPSALEIELLDLPDDASRTGAAGAGRRRRGRSAPTGIRFRQVRPTYAPLPYSDPLPYEEPWERAFR